MDRSDYPTLHFNTNSSEGTVLLLLFYKSNFATNIFLICEFMHKVRNKH